MKLAHRVYNDRWAQKMLLIEQHAPLLLSTQALAYIAQRMDACDMEDYYDTMERDNLEDLRHLLAFTML